MAIIVLIAEIDAQEAEHGWHTHKTSSHRAVDCERPSPDSSPTTKAEQKRIQWEKERGRQG